MTIQTSSENGGVNQIWISLPLAICAKVTKTANDLETNSEFRTAQHNDTKIEV